MKREIYVSRGKYKIVRYKPKKLKHPPESRYKSKAYRQYLKVMAVLRSGGGLGSMMAEQLMITANQSGFTRKFLTKDRGLPPIVNRYAYKRKARLADYEKYFVEYNPKIHNYKLPPIEVFVEHEIDLRCLPNIEPYEAFIKVHTDVLESASATEIEARRMINLAFKEI